MTGFLIRFLICNVFISILIGGLSLAKIILKNHLTPRMQYHLWFVLLALLIIPFLPFHLSDIIPFISWIKRQIPFTSFHAEHAVPQAETLQSAAAGQIQDFALSASRKAPSLAGYVLCGIWAGGILIMLFLLVKSLLQLNMLKQTALPLQNKKVRSLYNDCLDTVGLRRPIPIYTTAYLKTPIIAHVFRPCIYFPIHVISDFDESGIRYMLLHELQHHKHHDAILNCVINGIRILYWFNPMVWYAEKQMRLEQELACDSSVLKLLTENDYEAYGDTLIRLAGKEIPSPVLFAAGISGTMKQMQKRILNIANYKKPSALSLFKSVVIFGIVAALLFSSAPVLSVYTANENHFQWDTSSETISTLELSSYFQDYEGSFVLYHPQENKWSIYDQTHATTRTSPNSTYKIYDALFGLEEDIISPENSYMKWDGTNEFIETWNADQTLDSAMRFSVNWYFENIDRQLGMSRVRHYIQKIGYGNENVQDDFPTYWMESSLKISPVEQVQLLTDFYNNRFAFAPEHIAAVKDSLALISCPDGTLYGKTGTGRVDDKEINGWFVGFLESNSDTRFFAANIQSTENATGIRASEITLSILSELGIWEYDTHSPGVSSNPSP